MSMNWISLIGGGLTAAATLAVGISTSGIFAAAPNLDAPASAGSETIYVEQPVIEVAGVATPLAPASVDPIVIAILPATPSVASEPGATPVATDPTLPADPALPSPPYEDDNEYLDGDDGEYDDEYEGPEDGEDEDDHEYEGPEDGEDEGPEDGGGEESEEGDDD